MLCGPVSGAVWESTSRNRLPAALSERPSAVQPALCRSRWARFSPNSTTSGSPSPAATSPTKAWTPSSIPTTQSSCRPRQTTDRLHHNKGHDLGLSTDLCAVSDHAMVRTFAAGYREAIFGNAPPMSYWSTVTKVEDTIPVMLAVLDRELTGAVGCLDWYLRTPCWSVLCQQHPGDGDTTFCDSPSCALAAPKNRATAAACTTGWERRPSKHHGSAVPAPVWKPGSGTGSRSRAPTNCWPGPFRSARCSCAGPPSSAWTSPAVTTPRDPRYVATETRCKIRPRAPAGPVISRTPASSAPGGGSHPGHGRSPRSGTAGRPRCSTDRGDRGAPRGCRAAPRTSRKDG